MTLDEYLSGKPYTLTKEQYDYCNDVIYGKGHVANFSPAGTGKSLCLEIIKTILGDECIICATTGIANSILFNSQGGNGTCHKVFSLPTELHNSFHEKKVSPYTSGIFGKSDLVKVVIVEESGMLNPDQLALILKRLERFNRAYGKKRKKRDIKLVLQGDVLQLGAVITKKTEIDYMRVTYGSEWLFDCNVFKNMKFNVHLFTENKRSGDKVLRSFLEVLRYGQEHRYQKAIKWINQRHVPAPENIPVITTTNKNVDLLNQQGLENNPSELHVLKPIIKGRYDIKDCPAGDEIHIKVGAPCISLMNDKYEQYFNGSTGVVTQISHGEGVYVKFDHSGQEALIPMFTYENKEYFTNTGEDGKDYMDSEIVGTCTHTPIKVNYARTCYRVQGQTIDSPTLIDLGWGFNSDQDNSFGMQAAYVVFSRFKDIKNIYLDHKITERHFKVNRKAVDWVLSQTGNTT